MFHVWMCILIFLLVLYYYMCRFKRICKHLEQVQLWHTVIIYIII